MKKLLLFLFTFSLVAILHAATATVNGITWTYYVSNGEAQIYNSSYYYHSAAIPTSTSGAITIPLTLGGYPVTSIGDYAFYGCSSLTSVTIPSSVTSIGYNAFMYCYDLTSVTIPEGVTSIGDYAFYGCSSVTSFVVDSNNRYFSAVNGLLCSEDGKTLVACPGSLTSVTIPAGVTSIGSSAFSGCSRLTSVTIPSSVTSIGGGAFLDCTGLTSVTISEGVTFIGDKAFLGCSRLTSVTIPSSVTTIGEGAFEGNTSITFNGSLECSKWPSGLNKSTRVSVKIPEGVTSIRSSAFSGCSGLTSVTIPSSVTSIDSFAFSGCSSLTSLMIPSSVTSIGSSAFSGCSSLTSLMIPKGVTSIGNEAFADCSGLTSVTIPEGVTIATSSDVEISNGTWSAIDVSNVNCSYGYQSPSIGYASSTSMSVKVVGPTDFSFKWKVSSESGHDYLSWYLDGTQKNRISGTGGDWQTISCSIPKGEHTIQWTYSKDYSTTSGSDCGWVAFNWAVD